MINRKFRLWIIIFGFIVMFFLFRLPSKSAQWFLSKKYKVSIRWSGFSGGILNAITLKGVKILSKNNILLECPSLSSNIRFKDLISPGSDFPYYMLLKNPVISINDFSSLQVNTPVLFLNKNTKILISKAKIILEDPNKVIGVSLIDISGETTSVNQSMSINLVSPDGSVKLMGEVDLINRKGSMEISNGKVEFPKANLPSVKVDGRITLNSEGVELTDIFTTLGDLNLQAEGTIFNNRKISVAIRQVLETNVKGDTVATIPKFLIEGSLDEPKIITSFGVVETILKLKGMNYKNSTFVFPKITGEIKLPGFTPLELAGKIILGLNFVGFEDVTLANILNISGIISNDKDSKLNLWIDNAEGRNLAEQLPSVLRPLVSSHKIDAKLLLYGKINNLQGSGLLKIFSHPLKIVCRYRNSRFSFSSIGDGPLDFYGSINLDTEIHQKEKGFWCEVKEPKLKIEGLFHEMDFKDLIGFFSGSTDSNIKGVVSGEFKIKGQLKDPLIKAKLEIEDGLCGDVKFDVLYLNLEGTVDRLNLKHSMAYYKEVPAEVTGYIDPKASDLFANLEIIPTTDTFMWRGVNVIRNTEDRSVTFGQDVNENVSVHFKSPLSSDPEENALDTEPEIEVEYKILEDKSLLIKMEEEEGTVGVEHKVKF